MRLHWVDWTIWLGVVVLVTLLAGWTRRYTKSVADFLAANRCAGKYILAMGDGMAGLGAISIVAQFQMILEGGFTTQWWQSIYFAGSALIALSGWVIYRFRRTRVLTLPQFFEKRYSRRVRVFAGTLAFLAGIINFGIFPSVGARFFVYFCGLPVEFSLFGWTVSSYAFVMTCLLSISVLYACVGGQIAVLVTDFAQSVLCNVVFAIIALYFLFRFDWDAIATALLAAPANQSMVNPFQIGDLENYDLLYYLISLVGLLYGAYSWQGQQGYNTSARDAHHAKMSKVLGYVRSLTPMAAILMMALVAYAVLQGTLEGAVADKIQMALGKIPNEQVQKQMTVPIAMSVLLPRGLTGLLCAVMFAAFVTTHDTYLHSWGSILVQDMIAPLRKKPFTPNQHLWLLRACIAVVAVYTWLFSYYFVQRTDIIMFFALSGSIFLSGSGALIVGGLYWRRGTTAGAWTAMILSLVLSIINMGLVQAWPELSGLMQRMWPHGWVMLVAWIPGLANETFVLTAQELAFISLLVCGSSYVVVSLLTCRKPFNLDRLLHRGEYAVETEETPEERSNRPLWKRLLGLGKEIRLDDKFIFIFSYGYVGLNFAIVGLGTVYYLFFGVSENAWASFWHGYLWLLSVLTVIMTVWFSIGGVLDLRYMMARLKTLKRDEHDDGRVLDEE